MAISQTLLGIAGLTAGAAILLNLPVSWLFSTKRSTLSFLESAKLQTLHSSNNNYNFSAKELWKDKPAVIMAEAQGLSSLKPQLDAHGVHLHAVVHEILGVEEFKTFFDGEIYLDIEKRFYGPDQRWATLANLLRVNVLKNAYRVYKKGVPGNMEGEGRLLGGVFVIGAGNEGILFQHQEKEFGDTVDINDIMNVLKDNKKQQ